MKPGGIFVLLQEFLTCLVFFFVICSVKRCSAKAVVFFGFLIIQTVKSSDNLSNGPFCPSKQIWKTNLKGRTPTFSWPKPSLLFGPSYLFEIVFVEFNWLHVIFVLCWNCGATTFSHPLSAFDYQHFRRLGLAIAGCAQATGRRRAFVPNQVQCSRNQAETFSTHFVSNRNNPLNVSDRCLLFIYINIHGFTRFLSQFL